MMNLLVRKVAEDLGIKPSAARRLVNVVHEAMIELVINGPGYVHNPRFGSLRIKYTKWGRLKGHRVIRYSMSKQVIDKILAQDKLDGIDQLPPDLDVSVFFTDLYRARRGLKPLSEVRKSKNLEQAHHGVS